MPNRILRDWTDSYKIDELSIHSEVFFTRLIMKVDDFGRFYADARLLKANLFPLKSDVRETDISRWIAECEKAGLIAVYNVAQKRYLQIFDFNQRLRQKKEKFPSPDNGGQASVNGQSMVGLKRIETETEDEVEGKSSPPKFHPDSITTIESLAEECLSDQVNFVEHIYRQLRIDPKQLTVKLKAFNDHLKSLGEFTKTKKDYRVHFMNWYRKQPVTTTKKMREI